MPAPQPSNRAWQNRKKPQFWGDDEVGYSFFNDSEEKGLPVLTSNNNNNLTILTPKN